MLTVHVAMSVGWLGLDGALVALEVTGLSRDDLAVQAGIASAMAVIAWWVLMPVVFVSLASGLVLGLATPWGLVRHWWVLSKSVIALVLSITGALALLPRLHQILAGTGQPAAMQTLIARSMALMLLLAATAISIVKPWGKTPRGQAIQHAVRRRPTSIPDRQDSAPVRGRGRSPAPGGGATKTTSKS